MSRRFVVGSVLLAAIAGLGGLIIARQVRPRFSEEQLDASRRDRAIEYFEQALARDPDSPALKGQLISRLIIRFGRTAQLSDVARAEDLAASAVTLASDRSAALARLSGIHLMQHQFGPAFETAQAALAADTGSVEARGTLLEAALASGRYQVADSLASRLDQSSVSSTVRRALWLDTQGHTEQAVTLMSHACEELERSAAGIEGTAWCLTQVAVMTHALSGPGEAARRLERILAAAPGYRGAVEGLANLALADGRPTEALKRFQSILSEAHPDLYLRVAEAYRLLNQPEQAAVAEAQFLRIATAPGLEALFGHPLALFLAERRDPASLDSALAIATREVVRRPTSESFDLLGWVHFRRGEYRAALEASDRAAGWGSPGPTMQYHRARILAALGRTEEANRLAAAAAATPTLLAPHARRELDGSGG
ncbi:MAG: tetratricopeptide repeat protein [Gemmatimonadales bacterium]